MSRLGVNAKYRPRNDIEVEGRKVSGTGGFFDRDTLFFQGTVLVDMNPADMLAALNVPQEKLAKRALDSAAWRVTTLKELLGTAPPLDSVREALLEGFAGQLGITAVPGRITAFEESLAAQYHDEEIGTETFVAEIDDPAADGDTLAASHTSAGGTIRAYIRLEGTRRERIREALITGDFFVTPPRTIFDLEASLRNVAVAEAGAAIEQFFAETKVGLLTVAPADFRKAVEDAIASARQGPLTPA